MSALTGRRVGMVGGGNMAGALVRGLLGSGTLERDQLRASDPDETRRRALADEHGIVTHADNAELASFADVLVLAVKPQVIDGVLFELASVLSPDALLVSIAAGVPLSALEGFFAHPQRMVRAMPNTPALVLAGATALAAGQHATAHDLELASALFAAVGRVVVVPEAELDAVTGLSGSGPAYVMLFIESLVEGGVRAGLPEQAALELAAQTVFGSAKLLLETGEPPSALRAKVTSPNGTTVAGLAALESTGFPASVAGAVSRATDRARELGEEAQARLARTRGTK